MRVALGMFVVALAAACGPRPEASYVLGRGLKTADLSVSNRAAIYQEAIAGAFTVGDPSLYLLLDPRLLPRTGGFEEGEPMSEALRTAVLKPGIARGTCQPDLGAASAKKVAHCRASMAGYVVRVSNVFRMPGDTMEVYLFVQRYTTPTSVGIGRLRFERVYKVVRHGAAWDAVAEGRIEVP